MNDGSNMPVFSLDTLDSKMEGVPEKEDPGPSPGPGLGRGP